MKNTKTIWILLTLVILSSVILAGCATSSQVFNTITLGTSNLSKVPKWLVGTYYLDANAEYVDQHVFTLTKNSIIKKVDGEWVTAKVNIKVKALPPEAQGHSPFEGTMSYTMNGANHQAVFRFASSASSKMGDIQFNALTFRSANADEPFFGHLAAEGAAESFYKRDLPRRIAGVWYPSQQEANDKGGVVENGGWVFHISKRGSTYYITGGGLNRLGAGFMASEYQISRLEDTSFRIGGILIVYELEGTRITIIENNKSSVVEPGVYYKRNTPK